MIDREHLRPLVDEAGRLCVLAMDHRDSLRVEFDRADPASVPVERLVTFKQQVVAALGSRASAVMLDPELSIDQILRAGLLPDGVGSLCALEAQGYLDDASVVVNHLLEGWSPQRAKDVGASAAKLLVVVGVAFTLHRTKKIPHRLGMGLKIPSLRWIREGQTLPAGGAQATSSS